MSKPLNVICVGTPLELLESRRLVLESADYNTCCVAVSEAAQLLLARIFDVMILSATVSESDRVALFQIANHGLRIIQLDAFTDPQKLLTLLSRP